MKVRTKSFFFIYSQLNDKDNRKTSLSLCNTALEKGVIPLGDPPQKIADHVLMSVLRDDKENLPASFQFAYWLRVTCPAFFHFMMARRAEQTVNASIAKEPQRF